MNRSIGTLGGQEIARRAIRAPRSFVPSALAASLEQALHPGGEPPRQTRLKNRGRDERSGTRTETGARMGARADVPYALDERLMPGCAAERSPEASAACSSVRGREVRVELLAYLHRLFAGEAVAGGEVGDRFEVVLLSTRQAPVEPARRRVADVLEAVHHVAGDEDGSAVAGRRGPTPVQGRARP